MALRIRTKPRLDLACTEYTYTDPPVRVSLLAECNLALYHTFPKSIDSILAVAPE